MPIREYQAGNPSIACQLCRNSFERLEKLNDPPLLKCEKCGADLVRLISVAGVGASQSSADQRAKGAGFHKLKKLGRGEYEKVY